MGKYIAKRIMTTKDNFEGTQEQKIEAAKALYELYFVKCKLAYGTYRTEANEILAENGYEDCIME